MKEILLLCALSAAPAAHAELIPVEILTELPAADVFILGEVHDNPIHHLNQATVTAAVKPAALVFEMLSQDQANAVTAANRHNEAQLGAALQWEGTGWPDFAEYYPIFEAAPKAKIYGAKLARADVRRAVTEGAAVVFGEHAEVFGLTSDLSEIEQTRREAYQMQAHCDALPESMLGGMVQAQRLRDAALAAAIVFAHEATGGPVVVITGNGHARLDWGVPAILKIAAPRLNYLSLAQFEGPPGKFNPYDVHLITKPAQRDDPCAAFSKG